MADRATERMRVAAPPDELFAVVTDFERYPEWAVDIKHVQVLERDSEGRGVRVAFRAAAMGRSTSYTLAYDYSKAPAELSWRSSGATSPAGSTAPTCSIRPL